MDLFSLVSGVGGGAAFPAAEGEGAGLQLNLFWIIVSSLNFLLFLYILWRGALRPVDRLLEERRARIEQGLKDAEEAARERARAADERKAELAAAQYEAHELISRAQKVADESAAQLVATARAEAERLIERGRVEVTAEKERAIAQIRAEVADLAILAAGKVVGESLDGPRQRRLVGEFLASGMAGSTDGREGQG